MFNGHQLYIIGEEWVFDLTEFIGYKVKKNGDNIESFNKAFSIVKSPDHSDFHFKREETIPLGVMRKSKNIIENYLKEAMINV